MLGIFSNSYLYWDHEVNETNNRPRLEELATQAVTFLKTKAEAEDTGYFVMIEAGRIDQVARYWGAMFATVLSQGHHNGQATSALSETLAFDKAVEAVMGIVNTEDTLGKATIVLTIL